MFAPSCQPSFLHAFFLQRDKDKTFRPRNHQITRNASEVVGSLWHCQCQCYDVHLAVTVSMYSSPISFSSSSSVSKG
jgi:hypothetical protein